jgi:hypothetical protein
MVLVAVGGKERMKEYVEEARIENGYKEERIRKKKTIYRVEEICIPFCILHYDQQMHNYFTNYHTATCFDTVLSSSDRL